MRNSTQREKGQEILVVDDDPLALQTIAYVLKDHHSVRCFSDPQSAVKGLQERIAQLVILDLNLFDHDGLEVLKDWKDRFPELEIVFCSGEMRIERAIECLREGASDFIVKPFRSEELLLAVNRALQKGQLKRRLDKLTPLLHPIPSPIVGSSAGLRELLDKVEHLKHQTHLNSLILGESGTGKELVARLLHQQESDPGRPFVVVNMPAIPPALMEAELFGVERGAYTDAKVSRAGKFELADGGDIFLDEIGDLPYDTQAKMLRALQAQQIERVGSTRSQQIRFRVISATNQPLPSLVATARFREDLLYRLSDIVLWIPPLREKPEDIPHLVEHFVEKYSPPHAPRPHIHPNALAELVSYSWPGNVRQLESAIKRAIIFNRGPVIENVDFFDLASFPPLPSGTHVTQGERIALPLSHENKMARFEKCLIEEALKKNKGNKRATIEELGLSRATFYRKIQQLRIPLGLH